MCENMFSVAAYDQVRCGANSECSLARIALFVRRPDACTCVANGPDVAQNCLDMIGHTVALDGDMCSTPIYCFCWVMSRLGAVWCHSASVFWP